MSPTTDYRLKAPPHPGSFANTEFIEARGLSTEEAAAILDLGCGTLSACLNGRASISPEIALKFERAFGVSMHTLLRMQNSYDMAQRDA